MKINPAALLLIPLLISSCEKEDLDYRYKYTGKYDFEIEKRRITYEGDPSYGQFITTITNSTFSGSVRAYLPMKDMILVHWGNETINVEDGKIDQSRTIMTVDRDGNLDCPEVSKGFCKPAYIHGDTIRFTFYGGGGMAHRLGTSWHVTGLKK